MLERAPQSQHSSRWLLTVEDQEIRGELGTGIGDKPFATTNWSFISRELGRGTTLVLVCTDLLLDNCMKICHWQLVKNFHNLEWVICVSMNQQKY